MSILAGVRALLAQPSRLFRVGTLIMIVLLVKPVPARATPFKRPPHRPAMRAEQLGSLLVLTRFSILVSKHIVYFVHQVYTKEPSLSRASFVPGALTSCHEACR